MDVAGQAFAFAGGRLDLQGAGQGAFTGAGDLDDVADRYGRHPDQQDVVDRVPGGLAAFDDVGGGDEGGGEGRPPPAALQREGEDRARRPDRRQGGAVLLLGLEVGERGEEYPGEGHREIDAEETLGAARRVGHPGQGGERPHGQDGEEGDGHPRAFVLVAAQARQQDRVDQRQHAVRGQGLPQRLLDRHPHDPFAPGHVLPRSPPRSPAGAVTRRAAPSPPSPRRPSASPRRRPASPRRRSAAWPRSRRCPRTPGRRAS